MFRSTLLLSLAATVLAMYCEQSVSLPTASCCHTGRTGWLYNPLPEASHTPSTGVSDECIHALVHLVMHRHKDQERSRLRASFNAAVLWEEIGCTGGWFTESTQRGLAFYPNFFSPPPSPHTHTDTQLPLSLSLSLCLFLCLRSAGPHSKTNPEYF